MSGTNGMLDRKALEREIAEGGVETVITALPDMYGRRPLFETGTEATRTPLFRNPAGSK